MKGEKGMSQYTKIFRKLVPELVNIFHDSIISIILYGSVARDTQADESDIDFAVIAKPYTKNMHEQMTDLVVDLELEYYFSIDFTN